MENPEIINVYLENGDVAIRMVSNPILADVIIKRDGTIVVTPKEAAVALQEASNVVARPNNIEEDISNILIKIGMPANIKGYRYAREAIKIVISNPEAMNAVTKNLYPAVAKIFDTLPSRIERSIRHAIEKAYMNGNVDIQKEFFKFPEDSKKIKPTNSEFIFCLADHIRIIHML